MVMSDFTTRVLRLEKEEIERKLKRKDRKKARKLQKAVSDDISEYENHKKNWNSKLKQQQPKNNDPQAHRKEVRDRIGLGKKN